MRSVKRFSLKEVLDKCRLYNLYSSKKSLQEKIKAAKEYGLVCDALALAGPPEPAKEYNAQGRLILVVDPDSPKAPVKATPRQPPPLQVLCDQMKEVEESLEPKKRGPKRGVPPLGQQEEGTEAAPVVEPPLGQQEEGTEAAPEVERFYFGQAVHRLGPNDPFPWSPIVRLSVADNELKARLIMEGNVSYCPLGVVGTKKNLKRTRVRVQYRCPLCNVQSKCCALDPNDPYSPWVVEERAHYCKPLLWGYTTRPRERKSHYTKAVFDLIVEDFLVGNSSAGNAAVYQHVATQYPQVWSTGAVVSNTGQATYRTLKQQIRRSLRRVRSHKFPVKALPAWKEHMELHYPLKVELDLVAAED
jgi:hypothetical protein